MAMEVDVGAESMKRNGALDKLFAARHLGAIQAAGDFDAHAFGAGVHRGLESHFDGAAEIHTLAELETDVFGDQFGV